MQKLLKNINLREWCANCGRNKKVAAAVVICDFAVCWTARCFSLVFLNWLVGAAFSSLSDLRMEKHECVALLTTLFSNLKWYFSKQKLFDLTSFSFLLHNLSKFLKTCHKLLLVAFSMLFPYCILFVIELCAFIERTISFNKTLEGLISKVLKLLPACKNNPKTSV